MKGPQRQVILEALQFARSLGDLSENAEYHNAREEQARLEERISQIEIILRDSQLVTSHQKTVVSVGCEVTLQKRCRRKKYLQYRWFRRSRYYTEQNLKPLSTRLCNHRW